MALSEAMTSSAREGQDAVGSLDHWSRRYQPRLIALVSVLGTATQFRPAGTVGPAELLLLALLVGTWFTSGSKSLLKLTPITAAFLIYLLAGSAGSLFAAMSQARTAASISTLLAPFFILLVLAYVSTRAFRREFLRTWCIWFGRGFFFSQILLFSSFRIGVSLPAIQVEESGRYRSWATDPNQFGFFCLIAIGALLAAAPLRRSSVLMAAGVGALGWLTQSDGYRVAFIAGALTLYVGIVLGRAAHGSTAVRFLAITGLVAMAPLLPIVGSMANRAIQETAERGGQLSVREQLWQSCIDVFAQNPIIGLGPGAHSLPEGYSQPFECHSTPLDVLTHSGILGLGAFVSFAAFVTFRLWRRRDVVRLAVVTTVATAMLFTFLFRYPQLWFLLAYWCELAGQREPEVGQRFRASPEPVRAP